MPDPTSTAEPMKRGHTDAETAHLNGWGVGTLVRGHEMWADGVGVWTTWRITAIGEESVLVKGVRRDYTGRGAARPTDWRTGTEHSGTFRHREWFEVASASIDPPPHPPKMRRTETEDEPTTDPFTPSSTSSTTPQEQPDA